MPAAEGEARVGEEDAAGGQPVAGALHHDVEAPRAYKGDAPAVRDLPLGVVVRLVGRVVEATDREVGGRVEGGGTVQRGPPEGAMGTGARPKYAAEWPMGRLDGRAGC